ncbi:MAG: sarcosine oxidase subunit alpha family protein [Stappiaceae bacterium]
MTQPFRIKTGGRIHRDRPIGFSFNGKDYQGYEGDTLASALLANGVHLVARSFKYHRPRGIMTAGAEEPNAMVQLDTGNRTEPNLKATQVELFDGLTATSVNCWPSINFDVQAVNGMFHKLFPAGFYYKTMMSSPNLWHKFYEPMIRKAAGWGKAPPGPDPDFYDQMHVYCDVLVVGAGPAGLAAARAAASSGARVIIADEQSEFGGCLLSLKRQINGKKALTWVNEQVAALKAEPEVTTLHRTTIFGYYDQNYLVAIERRRDHLGLPSTPAKPKQRIWHIRAEQVVLATGSHERPLVFADNDRPGTMLAEAVKSYVNRFGVLSGSRAVLFTNNDRAYEAALDFHNAGGKVEAVVDIRPAPTGKLVDLIKECGIPLQTGQAIVATHGKKRVTGVDIMPFDGTNVTGARTSIPCDLLMTSGGWSPVVHLHSQAQGKLRYVDEKACFIPDHCPQDAVSVGGANGDFSIAKCLTTGIEAGMQAANLAGFGAGLDMSEADTDEATVDYPTPCWLVPGEKEIGHGSAKHFVDFQNDSTAADIKLASREGFRSVEHMKRYTLTGFGTDQGKTGNINGLAILAQTNKKTIPETGTTTFRPPYTSVTFGALAGRELGDFSDPVRRTPMHDWHCEQEAVFEDVGQWKRPRYFPKAGEDMLQAVNRECLAVRNGVGVLDATTLGKIDVRGKDAAEFLNRVYTNAWINLPVGSCRYGLMCGEDGMVYDDGVTARLGEHHFHMTTTTGGAATVYERLEDYLQTEWPDLDVWLTSVTEQWATISVAGPKARLVMEKLNPHHDWSNDAFPFMTFQDVALASCQARIFRISFTGELSFEINVPSRYGRAVWDAVMAAGEAYGITPYGTETMHVLRAEKGFIIVGQDTDATQTPLDLGMDWIVSKKKKDFVGKRSFSRLDTTKKDRKQLVGLLTENPHDVLDEGAQIIADETAPKPISMLGHVTSSYWSEALGHSIALAVVKGGPQRIGENLTAWSLGKSHKVKVVAPIFYDKESARRDG